jgi:hypothetical protein
MHLGISISNIFKAEVAGAILSHDGFDEHLNDLAPAFAAQILAAIP